ncbi:hypothetical protein IH980_01185 [Patescibacteria group bacterium]|nr:hypothetical protein [Patescibacteria group bacterium]
MINFLKLLGVLLLLILLVGTGQILAEQQGRGYVWILFGLGVIVWLWGYIVLIRVKGKEQMEKELKLSKNPFLIQQKQELESIKVAAISALIAISFFYFSISWIFKDDLILSGIVLLVTFLVSVQLQQKILKKMKKEEEY